MNCLSTGTKYHYNAVSEKSPLEASEQKVDLFYPVTLSSCYTEINYKRQQIKTACGCIFNINSVVTSEFGLVTFCKLYLKLK